jgi:hypothetical protein
MHRTNNKEFAGNNHQDLNRINNQDFARNNQDDAQD